MLAGRKILHHTSNVLETVVLINPSDEAVSTEVSQSEIFHCMDHTVTVKVDQRSSLRTQFGVLESRYSLIAAPDTQGIAPPSVRAELFKLRGLYTNRIHMFIRFPRTN